MTHKLREQKTEINYEESQFEDSQDGIITVMKNMTTMKLKISYLLIYEIILCKTKESN